MGIQDDVFMKIYGGLHTSEKWNVSDSARALYVTAGSWVVRNRTFGQVTHFNLRLIGYSPEVAAELVESGAWDATDVGYVFHNWDRYQTSRDEYETKNAAKREAGRKGGIAKAAAKAQVNTSASSKPLAESWQKPSKPLAGAKQTSGESYLEIEIEEEIETTSPLTPQGGAGGKSVGQALVTASAPKGAGARNQYTQAFEEFWAAYPRPADKARAFKTFQAATKTVDANTIIKSAHEYAAAVNGREIRFIKQPNTWLNAKGWEAGERELAAEAAASQPANGRPTQNDQIQSALETAAWYATQETQRPRLIGGVA